MWMFGNSILSHLKHVGLQVTFKKEGLQKGDKKYVKVGIPVT